MNATVLKIIEAKIKALECAARVVPISELRAEAAKTAGRAPDFFAAVVKAGELSFIKEIKRASILRGVLINDYNPLKIAKRAYVDGVHALSVFTEGAYHMGSDTDVTIIKENLFIPVMYRDYILDKYQIYLAASLGASAVMLTPSVLSNKPYREIFELCEELNVLPVPNCRSEDDIERSLKFKPKIISVNGRSLNTLAAEAAYARTLIAAAAKKTAVIADNCFSSPQDALELKRLGASALIIGEEDLRPDFAAQVRALEKGRIIE